MLRSAVPHIKPNGGKPVARCRGRATFRPRLVMSIRDPSMATAIYIVLFARDAWWIDLDGQAEGPFQTRQLATGEALARATATSSRGGRSEVRLSAPGHENELIYQSTARSLLSRVVADAHPEQA